MPDTFAETTYEAELFAPRAVARFARFRLAHHTDHHFRRDDHYWLDLCLTPRPEQARGCYVDRWGPHRYERLGEMFLVPPGETLHIRTDAGNQVSIVCEIAREAVDEWLEEGIEWTDRRLAGGLDMTHPHIRFCMMRLAGEVRAPGAGSQRLVGSVTDQLAIEVARYCAAIAEGPITGGLASWRLRLIDERLETPGAPCALEDLAALCNISVRQLTRGFRASRGCSIGDHIAQVKIGLAKRMLGTDETIKGIAGALGFSSPSAFSHAFRRATGATPRYFRQRQLRSTA